MNHRFTLPVTFAVALHGALLLHSNPTRPRTASVPELAPVVTDAIKIVEVEYRDTEVAAASGSPAPPLAMRPEPDAFIPEKLHFEMPNASLLLQAPTADWICHVGMSSVFEPGTGNGSIVMAAFLDNSPRATVQSSPAYPFTARREGLSGEVVVEFLVDTAGRVSEPRVARTTNHVFDEPSLRAVVKWRFEPGKRDGRVVPFRMTVPVVFTIQDT